MTIIEGLRQRLSVLRQRLRPPSNEWREPARDWMRREWKWLVITAVAVITVIMGDVWLATCGFNGCPSRAEIRAFRPTEGGRILDRNDRLIGYLDPVRRVNVPLEKVPLHVRNAFVATEDRRFYEHDGLDMRGFFRAVLRNSASFGVREGFSTITMQVSRNAFVAQRYSRRSLRRKLMELRLARLIEGSLEKDQILELYLNVIYLGSGTYGVEAASRNLFGKSVERLSLAEGAMLAALPKGPSVYTPRKDARRATARRNLVLGLMVDEGYITPQAAAVARERPLALAKEEWRPARDSDSYAIDAVREIVDSVLGGRAREMGDLTVHTTLDGVAQKAADAAVARRAAAIQRESRAWYGGTAPVQGAMVAIDPRSGDVRALVGGRSFEKGSFNRALSAKRQPGSAFKPFVYAAALAAGLTPVTMVDDEPVEITEAGRIWTPANYGGEYRGRVTLRRALMHSSNAAAVRLSRAVGEGRVIAAARENGITSPLMPVPAIALGALEVTPMELVDAYAPFANGGMRVTPRLVRRIEAGDGSLVWSSEIDSRRVMDERDAWQVTSMLRSVVDEGTGAVIRRLGVSGPVAGKTGTTNNGADVWFVGYTPTLVAGFWFGYDAPRPLSGDASGGRLAAPAWAEFYQQGWRERGHAGDWAPPEGMIERDIDPETGLLAGEWCPTTQREWFKPGTEPTSPCRDHDEPLWEDEWAGEISDRVGKMLKRVFSF